MGSVTDAEIRDFLLRLGEKYLKPAKLYLLGGGALRFLGSSRRTVDIDFKLETAASRRDELIEVVETLANELQLELEIVPIEEFIPLPEGVQSRHQRVEQFGTVEVYIYDPYSIALSKIARGFEADLQDVVFLLEENIIDLGHLDQYVEDALPVAWEYDIDPADLELYLAEVRRLYSDS
jgi:hypothetical protein